MKESLSIDENFDLEAHIEQSSSYTPTEVDIYEDVLPQIDRDSIEIESKELRKSDRKRHRRHRSKSQKRIIRNLTRLLTHRGRKERQRLELNKEKGKYF